MKTVLYAIFTVISLMFVSCTLSKNGDNKTHTIYIKESLNNFEKQSLSGYAKDIRYVKLETGENCFVTQAIQGIYLINGLIYVHDYDAYLKVYDGDSGKYLFKVGGHGNGRGELPYLSSVDINAKEDYILLNSAYSNVFDLKGNFKGRFEEPKIEIDGAWLANNIVMVGKNQYSAGFSTNTGHQKYALTVFNEQGDILAYLNSYRDRIQEGASSSCPFDQTGLYTRNRDDIFYYRGLSDTIYRYNSRDTQFVPYLTIEYGKHLQISTNIQSEENPDFVSLSAFVDNERYSFLQLATLTCHRETYPDKIIYPPDFEHNFDNSTIWGIYDHKQQTFTLLLQSVKGLPGLGNDLDGGLPFFPKSISSENELVDYYHADRFLAMASKLPNPSESFKEFIKGISEEDNPIIIIAK
ncbi:hypothetical protein BN938_0486 [Mucinivorans hirudinis]|uniref:DUF4934 domain-containing protein n=1 Tax=Mucinivorans hirudinis TaxID=1433126 RepID=A0A060R6C6_9BACT|nr:hypothetical protein BN938_0486 [Mucinivorans hirudinis]